MAATALAVGSNGEEINDEEPLPYTAGVKGASEGVVEELAAATAHVLTLQAQLGESEQLRAALEARLMHAAEPSATSSLGAVHPEERKEPVQDVDIAAHQLTIKAYYGSTFDGVVLTPAASDKIEAARSKATMADMELGTVGIASVSALFADDMRPGQVFEAVSRSGKVGPADDRHIGPILLPTSKRASTDMAPLNLHDGLDEQLYCHYGYDTDAAPFFEAIDLSGQVELVDDQHSQKVATLPDNMAKPTEMHPAVVGVEDGANLRLQVELNHDAKQPAYEVRFPVCDSTNKAL